MESVPEYRVRNVFILRIANPQEKRSNQFNKHGEEYNINADLILIKVTINNNTEREREAERLCVDKTPKHRILFGT